jgi:hypothetical protein
MTAVLSLRKCWIGEAGMCRAGAGSAKLDLALARCVVLSEGACRYAD